MTKTVYSGIQPSGRLTLGNYIGAVNNWRKLQEDGDKRCLFAVADLHAITVRQDPEEFRQTIRSTLALLLAVGIDPDKSILYLQSQVPQHAELTWLLNCYTYVGEMNRMTQFKDKSAKHSDNINMGLMDYPVLMAADILLYGTDIVPIGQDQVQHLEIARDVAVRINNCYGDIFRVPEGFLPKAGAKIMSLQDPTAKMSKSDPTPGAAIYMLDPPEEIARKIKRAVTDSGTEVRYDPVNQPGIANLLTILSCAEGVTAEQAAEECAALRYGELKLRAAEAVTEMLRPCREAHARYLADDAYLAEVMKKGRSRATEIAEKRLDRFKAAIGFIL